MRISKIKRKDGWITIQSVEKAGSTEEREINFKCADDPHEDFNHAFDALIKHARDILEWPLSYAEGRIQITGVSISFSESTEVEGAVLTGIVGLEMSDAPFCFNTPHLPFAQYSEGGCAPLMPDLAIDAIERLRREAHGYIKGKRAQGDFFAPSSERVLVRA